MTPAQSRTDYPSKTVQSESDNSLATQESSLQNSLFLIRLDTYTNMKALGNYLVQYEQIYHRENKKTSFIYSKTWKRKELQGPIA